MNAVIKYEIKKYYIPNPKKSEWKFKYIQYNNNIAQGPGVNFNVVHTSISKQSINYIYYYVETNSKL